MINDILTDVSFIQQDFFRRGRKVDTGKTRRFTESTDNHTRETRNMCKNCGCKAKKPKPKK